MSLPLASLSPAASPHSRVFSSRAATSPCPSCRGCADPGRARHRLRPHCVLPHEARRNQPCCFLTSPVVSTLRALSPVFRSESTRRSMRMYHDGRIREFAPQLAEVERVIDIEVVPVAQLEHHTPEDPCDERGDRGGPKPSARARPGIAPVQHRRDDDRREQRTNDVDERVLSYFCDATDGSSRCFGRTTMKWITREHPRGDRVACPWLIERFVDKQAEFIYVPSDQVAAEAQKRGATPYDTKDVELGHHGAECSFDAFVHKYGLEKDPAMAYMAKVIRGADTADKTITPESQGVEAILDGIRHVHYPNDQKQREASRPLLDALYAFCQKKVEAKAA